LPTGTLGCPKTVIKRVPSASITTFLVHRTIVKYKSTAGLFVSNASIVLTISVEDLFVVGAENRMVDMTCRNNAIVIKNTDMFHYKIR